MTVQSCGILTNSHFDVDIDDACKAAFQQRLDAVNEAERQATAREEQARQAEAHRDELERTTDPVDTNIYDLVGCDPSLCTDAACLARSRNCSDNEIPVRKWPLNPQESQACRDRCIQQYPQDQGLDCISKLCPSASSLAPRQSFLSSVVRIKSMHFSGNLGVFSGGRLQPPRITVVASFKGIDFQFYADESINSFERMVLRIIAEIRHVF
jgi:hypothetical protein